MEPAASTLDLPSGNIRIHPAIGAGLDPASQRIAPVVNEELAEEGYFDKKFLTKVLKISFVWSGFFISLGSVSTAIATYISSECSNTNSTFTESESPGENVASISNIVVSATASLFTFLRECYDYKKNEQNEKNAFIEKTTREQLEKERYEELHQMLVETTSSLQKYERNKNTENFQHCLKSIRNLPKGSKKSAPIRDEWLSKLIAISDTQKELQQALQDLEQLGKEIQETNKEIFSTSPAENGQKGAGERSAQGVNRHVLDTLGTQVNNYQNSWQALVAELGFSPESITINGTSYDKNGKRKDLTEDVRIKV